MCRSSLGGDVPTEVGKMVEPCSYALLAENLDLPPGQSMGVKMFQGHLLSMATLVARARAS